jgi:hypothetical protein
MLRPRNLLAIMANCTTTRLAAPENVSSATGWMRDVWRMERVAVKEFYTRLDASAAVGKFGGSPV